MLEALQRDRKPPSLRATVFGAYRCFRRAGAVQNCADCLDYPDTPSPVCLMAGSINHEVFSDPELRGYVQQQMSMFAERMAACLSADKEAGLLPADFDAQVVVAVIVTYLQGLWRMAMVSYDRARFERQIAVFLSGLGL